MKKAMGRQKNKWKLRRKRDMLVKKEMITNQTDEKVDAQGYGWKNYECP